MAEVTYSFCGRPDESAANDFPQNLRSCTMYDSPMDFLPCGLRLSSAPSEGCEESAISSLVEPVWKKNRHHQWQSCFARPNYHQWPGETIRLYTSVKSSIFYSPSSLHVLLSSHSDMKLRWQQQDELALLSLFALRFVLQATQRQILKLLQLVELAWLTALQTRDKNNTTMCCYSM